MNLPSFDFNDIISFIISPSFSGTLLVLKVLFIVISFYFIISIIYFLSKTRYFQWLYGESLVDAFTKRPYGVKKMDKIWDMIMEKLKSDSESDYKLAVIEADGVLDEVFKKVGYKGKDLEARLKQLSPVHYPNLDKMKEAHQIRNDIVRDPDYQLGLSEAKKALAVYRKILEELEVF